ncbi:MAG: GNAT family N-acetyltransferase [Rikenellaceae bacterium]|nr:GNAT family N-acetyltransferase [Rikenellaceae bacterium]
MKAKDIHLRALEPEDIGFLYRWENDPEVWRVSETTAPYSKYVLKRYIETSHLDIYETKQQRFVIVHSQTNIPVGAIDLFDFDPFNRRAGVGILIYDEQMRGKGFAAQALDKLVEYAFDVLGLHQLYCNIPTDNTPSYELFSRRGFIQAGIRRDWIRVGQQWKDELTLQLINKK